jgi:hypothetical protein
VEGDSYDDDESVLELNEDEDTGKDELVLASGDP